MRDPPLRGVGGGWKYSRGIEMAAAPPSVPRERGKGWGNGGSDERIFWRPPTGVNIPLQRQERQGENSSPGLLSMPSQFTENWRELPISAPRVHFVEGYSLWKGSPTWAEGLWTESQTWGRRQNLQNTHTHRYTWYRKMVWHETRNLQL